MRSFFGLVLWLCCLPFVAGAQEDRPYPPHGGTSWWRMLQEGGLVRKGDLYLSLPDGISDLLTMNYVDGYTFGPHCVLGCVLPRGGRIEVEPTLRYACSREVALLYGALRYHAPIEKQRWIEVSGGKISADFDRDPLMSEFQYALASGIFGWNDYKLYERTSAGVRASTALGGALQLTGSVAWERREQLFNHRRRNIFRKTGDPNIPDNYLHPASQWASDPWFHFGRDELWRADLRLDYMPGRVLYIFDDMTVLDETELPVFSLGVSGGLDATGVKMSSWRYMALELSVTQHVAPFVSPHEWRYRVSGGLFLRHRGMMLADYHHFDASTFCFQTDETLTWFSLLTNYELSTDLRWAEAHGEWLTEEGWLSRLCSGRWLREYVQVHLAAVPKAPVHSEIAYGIELMRNMRLGAAIGFDDVTYDGVAFQFVIDLHKARTR